MKIVVNKVYNYILTNIKYFILIILLLIFFGYIYNKNYDLYVNGSITNAKIITYNHDKIILGTTFNINYKINGVEFREKTFINVNKKYASLFIGKYFPLFYSKKNPTNFVLLTSKKSFKKYNISYPDSLKWANKYHY